MHQRIEAAGAEIHFVDTLREGGFTPHIAVCGRLSKFVNRQSTRIDRRNTRMTPSAAPQSARITPERRTPTPRKENLVKSET